MNEDTDKPALMTFPCEFPIKIMGARDDGFAQEMLEIVTRHAPDFDAAATEMRVSKGGKYLSLTCTIQAMSKAQLDAIYMELSQHPAVKVAL